MTAEEEFSCALLPGQWTCFWCQRAFWKRQLTDDHVVPACVGGTTERSNIVRACTGCQIERSQIIAASGKCRELNRRTDPQRHKYIDRMRSKLPKWLALQRKWVELERLLLGYSPSAVFPIGLKEGVSS